MPAFCGRRMTTVGFDFHDFNSGTRTMIPNRNQHVVDSDYSTSKSRTQSNTLHCDSWIAQSLGIPLDDPQCSFLTRHNSDAALLSSGSSHKSDPRELWNYIMSSQTNESTHEVARWNFLKENRLPLWNTASFALNFVVTYGVGTLGWLGNGTNQELSEKYQVR